MKYGLYSIFDAKTGFLTPTVDSNDDSAIRNFAHAVANSEGILYSFAQDFQLYRLGDFDSDTGSVLQAFPTVLLITGPDAIRMMQGGSSNG